VVPTGISLENIQFFLTNQGMVPALLRSLTVGGLTVALSLLLGCPAGYALARYWFRRNDVLQLLLVTVRAIPMVIIAVPLLVTFIVLNLNDTATVRARTSRWACGPRGSRSPTSGATARCRQRWAWSSHSAPICCSP
jgi:ABC-type glycerol-3-phosphate transport system permease component